ncbi:MAG: recombinase family protein [Alistipes sp.]|nr:recombinase family protein [Bacteroidales bacterium]MBO7264154.1 recombinase family protein [Alistipes sp.]
MKVVILARVSTDKQLYERQVVEMEQYCKSVGWDVAKIFTNKVSGAKKNEDRPEIMEMLAYIEENKIDKVCVLEISRLGRNTLEALKVIELLNEKKICLFIKNYNLETLDAKSNVNPITSLICTILLEISSMERHTIIDRMSSGRDQYIAKCRKEGIKMGRPSTYRKSDDTMREQYKKEISLLKQGMSLRNISIITGTSIMTIRKLYKFAQ